MSGESYLTILSELLLPRNGLFQEHIQESTTQKMHRISPNLQVLRSRMKESYSEISFEAHALLSASPLEYKIPPNMPPNDLASQANVYATYLQYLLIQITRQVDFSTTEVSKLVSVKGFNSFIAALGDLAYFGLRRHLHPLFLSSKVFGKVNGADKATTGDLVTLPDYELLQLSIELVNEILKIEQVHVLRSMDAMVRDYMAAIYTIKWADHTNELSLTVEELKQLDAHLETLWSRCSRSVYFSNLLLLKGIASLPRPLHGYFHVELLNKLQTPAGFSTLVNTLIQAAKATRSQPVTFERTYSTIADIVAHRSHSESFHRNLISQIVLYLSLCTCNTRMNLGAPAAVLCLCRLYDLNSNYYKEIDAAIYELGFKKLADPPDLLCSLIVFEHSEISVLLGVLQHLFDKNASSYLPKQMLMRYLPILLQLFKEIPKGMPLKATAKSLIQHCFKDPNRDAVYDLTQKIYVQNGKGLYSFHPRLVTVVAADGQSITVQVGAADAMEHFQLSQYLPVVLGSLQMGRFAYMIFQVLLELMTVLWDNQFFNEAAESAKVDSDDDDSPPLEETAEGARPKQDIKMDIVLSLDVLVREPCVRREMTERPSEMLKLLETLINRYVEQTTNRPNCNTPCQTLLLMLTIVQELLIVPPTSVELKGFRNTLTHLQSRTNNEVILHRISSLISTIDGTSEEAEPVPPKDAYEEGEIPVEDYSTGRIMMLRTEPHLCVYGINILIKLLKAKDKKTLANKHIIMVLGLNAMRTKESFVFLTCVKLFVQLAESDSTKEVINLLIDEYMNESSEMDFRLVVGEALVKTCVALGPLCYNYKDQLINCFMRGIRSPNDEFRMSSYSNLGNLCLTMIFQLTSFLQELITAISEEIVRGTYVPAQRAAMTVLADILHGMDDLVYFGDMLPPLYGLLKAVERNPTADPFMRIHAVNGLKTLDAKCHALIFPKEELTKKIKIMGIKDKL